MSRRDFLRASGLAAVGATVGSSLFARAALAAPAVGAPGPYGPLRAADANGIELPEGFRSRVLAVGKQKVAGTQHSWHEAPDGGAVFARNDGWIYVSNSELGFGQGGVGALRFDAAGNVKSAYSICSGTSRNCAGGATPWGTWLSCEEVPNGLVHECDPIGAEPPVPRPALGTFNHEAVAVDPERRHLYLTEDRGDGLLYRFTPDHWGDLSAGRLEAAIFREARVGWGEVPNPNPWTLATQTRSQVLGATAFNGGEGIVYHDGHVSFTTKGDNRVWDLDIAAGTLAVLYDDDLDPEKTLTGVDNITVTPSGGLIVAEDPGDLSIVLLTRDGTASRLLRVTGQPGSELTGPAFDPSGTRLYFSSQRGGTDGAGITYEVTGPFRRAAA